ncbi:MAG: deoxynucleoside kinase [Chloroflexi bacterium]|nr:deoxynucleoside kinase [Chloroflexota bacterium]
MQKNYYVAIEGVIGVGKTTLARAIQREFGAEILLEVFEENPFLARFYQDRKRYGFQTQIFFLLSRFHQQHQSIPAALERAHLISDYTFDKDYIFARLNIDGDELSLYEQVHAILAGKLIQPDLVVYLRASPATLMQRIALRDRSYERAMEPDYIEALHRAYEDYFARYATAPVLTLDSNRLDFVQRAEDLRFVLDSVRAELKSGAYQEPLL